MNTYPISDLGIDEEFETILTHARGRVIRLQPASKSVIAVLVYPDGRISRRDLHANVRVAVPAEECFIHPLTGNPSTRTRCVPMCPKGEGG